MDEVLENRLYVGSMFAAEDKDLLARAGITHIINAAYSVPCLFPQEFEYLAIPALDREDYDISESISACIKFYNKAISGERPGKVFVHCVAGVSRSGAIAIAIIMHAMNLSYEKALSLPQSKRPSILPNPGFAVQLKTWWLNGMKI